MKHKNSCGRSMIEMVLYLGLIVVITTGSFKLYSDSVKKTRYINADNQIDDIVEKVNLIYMGRPFTAIADISTNVKNKGVNIVDPWGMNIKIESQPGKVGGVAGNMGFVNQYMTITFDNLNKADCMQIASIANKKSPIAVGVNDNTGAKNIDGPDLSAVACKVTGNKVYMWFKKS